MGANKLPLETEIPFWDRAPIFLRFQQQRYYPRSTEKTSALLVTRIGRTSHMSKVMVRQWVICLHPLVFPRVYIFLPFSGCYSSRLACIFIVKMKTHVNIYVRRVGETGARPQTFLSIYCCGWLYRKDRDKLPLCFHAMRDLVNYIFFFNNRNINMQHCKAVPITEYVHK